MTESNTTVKRHIYKMQFDKIIEEQSDNLSPIKMLLKIDLLSCLEAESFISIISDTYIGWFYVLSTIINHYYFFYAPEIREFSYIREIVEAQSCIYTEDGKKSLSKSENILRYISMRKELIRYLRTKHDLSN